MNTDITFFSLEVFEKHYKSQKPQVHYRNHQ